MFNYLIRKYVKNYENTNSAKVRFAYGRLAGVFGIIVNIILALIKGLAGLFSGSIAVLADALNSLSDAVTSIITLVGFKLAAKEKDAEHPYGHSRMEYMTGIGIAALIVLLGFQLVSTSYKKVLEPEVINFSLVLIIILVISIGLKIIQALFYYHLAKKAKAASFKASAADSRNDVISTSAVLVSVIVGRLFEINIDGYMGMAVGVFIIVSGIQLIRETSSPLLGKVPDKELVDSISNLAKGKPNVLGIHDLVVHDYGPSRIFASIHIEVDSIEDIMKSHETIDEIEKEAMEKLNVELVGHMDPVDTDDPLATELREEVEKIVKDMEDVVEMHDLRLVKGEKVINVIFDLVLTYDAEVGSAFEIKKIVSAKLKELNPKYESVITFDTDYSGVL